MKCPVCNTQLSRTTYEDVPLFRCADCDGYLVDRRRMILVKASRDRSPAQLQAEGAATTVNGRDEQVRCPRCLEQRMTRERVGSRDKEQFELDACEACDVVWFDGGELARMQLHYEESAQAIESLARQRRASRLDTDGSDEFERNLAALPQRESWLSQALGETVLVVPICVLAALAILLGAVGFPQAAAVASVIAAALLAKLVLPRTPGTFKWFAGGAIVLCEVLVLLLLLR